MKIKKGKEKKKEWELGVVLIGIIVGLFLISVMKVEAAEPSGPDTVTIIANETKAPPAAKMVNISGGRIATLEINATVQNPRWKGFVGQVNGKFTLDDASGSTLYDWSFAVTQGEVYATRNSSSIMWSNIECANSTTLSQEDTNMEQTGNDNITATFNATNDAAGYGTHDAFYVGSIYISANSCPNLNTYVNSASQTTSFDEVALYDGVNIVYAALMEDNAVGFDGNTYDFQMIVPENGNPSFTGATAYYLYIELG